MGATHFDMMRDDAILIDKQAVPLALAIYQYNYRMEQSFNGKATFSDAHFDQLVHMARGLLPLRDEFTRQMQDLLAAGKIHVRVPTINGEKLTRRPDVFTFDEAIADDEIFTYMLKGDPDDFL